MFHVFPIEKVTQSKHLCTIHNMPELLSVEDLQKGFGVDVVPAEPQVGRDEVAVSYCDPETRAVWYEIEKKPVAVAQTEMINILYEQTKSADQRFRDLDPEATLLDQYKSAKVAQLNEKYYTLVAAGFTSSGLGVEHIYPADAEARENIQMVIKRLEIAEKQAVAAGVDLSVAENRPTFAYLTLDAGALPHTLDELERVFADGVDAAAVLLAQFRTFRDQANAAQTNYEVAAVQW